MSTQSGAYPTTAHRLWSRDCRRCAFCVEEAVSLVLQSIRRWGWTGVPVAASAGLLFGHFVRFHSLKRGESLTYGTRQTLTYGIGVSHTDFEVVEEGSGKLPHQTIAGTSKCPHDALHLEVEENHADAGIRDVGIDRNLVDVLVFHFFQCVDQ